MTIEVVTTFQKAETVWVLAYNYNRRTGAPANAGTSIKVAINKPDGTEELAATDMVNHATGEYEYFHTPSSSAVAGWYAGTVTLTDGTNITITTFGFRVK